MAQASPTLKKQVVQMPPMLQVLLFTQVFKAAGIASAAGKLLAAIATASDAATDAGIKAMPARALRCRCPLPTYGTHRGQLGRCHPVTVTRNVGTMR